jgi:hypothetical protein
MVGGHGERNEGWETNNEEGQPHAPAHNLTTERLLEVALTGPVEGGPDEDCRDVLLSYIRSALAAGEDTTRIEHLVREYVDLARCSVFLDLINFVATDVPAGYSDEAVRPSDAGRATSVLNQDPSLVIYQRAYKGAPVERSDVMITFGYPIIEQDPAALGTDYVRQKNGCWIRFTNAP